WSAIATRLPGRTDNEIKNFWNTHLKKKLLQMGIDPVTHRPRTDHLNLFANLPQLLLMAAAAANFSTSNPAITSTTPSSSPWPGDICNASLMRLNLQSTTEDATTQLAKIQLLHNNLLQLLITRPPPSPTMEALNLGGGSTLPLHHHLYEHLTRVVNSQFESSVFPINLASDPIQILSNFPNIDAHQPNCDVQLQPVTNSKSFVNGENKNCDDQFLVIPAGNSLPGLFSASPDQRSSAIDQMEMVNTNTINPTEHISNPSSTSTTFEAWGELMGDDAGDSYWREIVDQTKSPSWSIS
ncbi:hypothetical protein U1Q18_031942, partial [Sarracenia purpurea var. burkii]